MKPILNTFLLLLLCSTMDLLHGQNNNLKKEIGKIIRYESNIDFSRVPGVMVGVLDGSNKFINSYGEQLDPDSIYELGGVTMPIVAWLVHQALDSLGWKRDASVCQFLPDSLCHGTWLSLNIDHILNQRSGLPKRPNLSKEEQSNENGPYTDYDYRRLSKDLAEMIPVPGTYGYSNIAYALLYWLFEQVGGMESFANQRLFVPFMLDKTGWNFPDEMVAKGHSLGGRVKSHWQENAFASASGLAASMNDMLILLDVMSPDLIEATPLLTPSMEKEFKELYKAREHKVIDGWFLSQSGKDIVYYFTSSTVGHHVSVAFMPQKRKGVVVFSNGAFGSNDLCHLVLDMISR